MEQTIPAATMPVPPTELKIVAHYAGFWKRVAAYLLDGMVLSLATWPCIAIANYLEQTLDSEGLEVNGPLGLIAGSLPYLILWWLYFAIWESSKQQATLGKMALSIRVTDIDGSRLDFWSATTRFIAKFTSYATFGVGFAMAGVTEKKQALHDMIMQTLVVEKERIVPIAYVRDLPVHS